MKKLQIAALILVAIVATLGWTQQGVRGEEATTRVWTKHIYGNIQKYSVGYEDYKPITNEHLKNTPPAVWKITRDIAIVAIDGDLKANEHNSSNSTKVAHASMVLHRYVNGQDKGVLFYIAAFDGLLGELQNEHFNLTLPAGSGFYLFAGDEVWLTGRATSKPGMTSNFSGCFTIYYVNR